VHGGLPPAKIPLAVATSALVQDGERFFRGDATGFEIGEHGSPSRAAVVGSFVIGGGLARVAERLDNFVESRADRGVGNAELAFDFANDAAVLDEDLDEVDLRPGELEELREGELAIDGD